MSQLQSKFVDQFNRPLMRDAPVALKKKAFGLFGSIYEYPNQQRFHPRQYVNTDTEIGASFLNRDLLVRWSRELSAQLPFIQAGVKTLALFSVGSEYNPVYAGNNSQWGEQANAWLKEVFLPNPTKRGPTFDWNTFMFVSSQMIDIDGDFLLIFGESDIGPKIQMIPCHRITSMTSQFSRDTIFPTAQDEGPKTGPIPNTIISDGVVYDKDGGPVGYNVQNPKNLVNTLLGGNQENTFFSTKNSRLVFDPRFFDRGRGFPTVSSAVLQGLSLEEIESYMIEKIKIQSMIALVEANPQGEGPMEEEETMRRMYDEDKNLGLGPGVQTPQNASKGLRIVTDPAIRYVVSNGGEIKPLAAQAAENECAEYISRLEAQVLSTLGIPHALLFSPDEVAGKMNSSVVEIFNGSIKHRQKTLDKQAKFIIGWALAKAIKSKDLPPNDKEILTNCFEFTHPNKFTIEDSKDRSSDLSDYQAGVMTLDDVARKHNTTSEAIIASKEKESIMFFQSAQRIAKQTGVDLPMVIQSLRDDLKSKPINPFGGGQ